MKVALYIPPIPDKNTVPHLGPLYLLSTLEQNGFEGRLFDARIDKHAFNKVIKFKPDIFGVSAVTPAYLGGLRAAMKIKKIFPNVTIVFGGPHPSSLPREVVAVPSVDFVLIGETETNMVNLCSLIRDKEVSSSSLQTIKNLAFKKDNEVFLTEIASRITVENLDDLPYPAFHKMDLDTYFTSTQAHGLFKRGKRVLPIMSTRGCPHSCTFCCRVMGKKIRNRSVESVMAEIRFLVDNYGIDELYFEDDNFTIQRNRALEILDRLAAFKPPINIKFANGVRGDRMDKEILEAMKKARVYSLSFGIESGCPETLGKMKKNLNLKQVKEKVLLAKSMGFLVGANCILGYPGETLEDIQKSLDFFLNLPLDSMAIVNLVPFPGTEVRQLCEKEGYLTDAAENWDNYFFSINNPIPLVETPNLSKEELIHAIKKAYRKMYLRPKWIWQSIPHLSPRQIALGAAIMLNLYKPQNQISKTCTTESEECYL